MAAAGQWITRHPLLVVVVGLPLLTVGWSMSAYPRGMIAAWFDHACGHYEVKSAGYPVYWAWEYRRLLQERYGVKDNHVAECKVSIQLDWYIDGYNSVSRPRIKAHFGKDIFAECLEEAETVCDEARKRTNTRFFIREPGTP
jgi:hypothetical protein